MHRFLTIAALCFGAAGFSAAHAGEALPSAVAQRLDRQPAAFAMSEAKRERLMIIQENMERQEHWRRRNGGYRHDYGPRFGGPPPWAPAYGYRRHHRDWDDED